MSSPARRSRSTVGLSGASTPPARSGRAAGGGGRRRAASARAGRRSRVLRAVARRRRARRRCGAGPALLSRRRRPTQRSPRLLVGSLAVIQVVCPRPGHAPALPRGVRPCRRGHGSRGSHHRRSCPRTRRAWFHLASRSAGLRRRRGCVRRDHPGQALLGTLAFSTARRASLYAHTPSCLTRGNSRRTPPRRHTLPGREATSPEV